MKKLFKEKIINKKKGFVLLFSVLVATLILAVGASIISIALKQVILSGAGRDSQFAFYAANTGAECALYWDLAGDSNGNIVFATSSTNLSFDKTEVTCLGKPLVSDLDELNDVCPLDISTDPTWCVDDGGPDLTQTKFRITYENDGPDSQPYCADVIVKKYIKDGEVATTTIDSRGYNTCETNNPRRIERGLEFNY